MDVKVTDLRPFPGNARRGNVGMIMQSLAELGQYRPIVVNKRDQTILAGNHTWEAAKQLGWDKIAVQYVDVDDQMAVKINLADNRANDLAEYDDDALTELLRSVEELAGTGFTDDDLAAMISDAEADFDPVEDTNRVDVSAERTCPACGHHWREGVNGQVIE